MYPPSKANPLPEIFTAQSAELLPLSILSRRDWFAAASVALGTPLFLPNGVRGDAIPQEYREVIKKGLDWLVKSQAKDGHWEAFGGQYPAADRLG